MEPRTGVPDKGINQHVLESFRSVRNGIECLPIPGIPLLKPVAVEAVLHAK